MIPIKRDINISIILFIDAKANIQHPMLIPIKRYQTIFSVVIISSYCCLINVIEDNSHDKHRNSQY